MINVGTVGGYLEFRGGVQYRGDIMIHVGGYHEYRGEKIFCYLGTPRY